MSYADVLKILDLFRERDYAQVRPHLYIRSPKSNKWVRPKGMQVLHTTNEIAILDVETEEWESIPFDKIDFGLW